MGKLDLSAENPMSSKIMNIVLILPGDGISGGVRATVIVGNYLLNRGHAVRILYRRSPITIKKIVNYVNLLNKKKWLADFKGKTDSFKDITKCYFNESEIIIGVGMWVSKQLARLSSLSNPKLQYIHGATPWDIKLMVEALKLSIPKVVVASFLKPIVESFGGGEVLAIIPNGIDRDQYFPSVDNAKRDGIGTIYSSHPAKDPETILRVLEKISKLRPDITIRVFSTEKRPKQIPKSSYFRLPSIETAREIYSKSLVWIVASKSEGFSMPILEAMACGSVVVSTDCGGPRDIIKNGENGFLVPVGDVEGIAKKISELLENPSLLKYMQTHGKETAERFTWKSSIDALENALAGLQKT